MADTSLFANHVERVELSGRALQKAMAEKGARYCLKINQRRIAISKSGGVLLGESLADYLDVKGSAVITFKIGDVYFIVSYDKNGVISEFMNVAGDDYHFLLEGECSGKELLFVCCEEDEFLPLCGSLSNLSDLDIKRVELSSIDGYLSKVESGAYIKLSLHRPKKDKKSTSPAIIFGGVALLVAVAFLMRNSGEEEAPVDPYAAYKAEMSGITLSSALMAASDAVVSSLDISTWKVDYVTVDAAQASVMFTPVLENGLMKEISEWCTRRGYSYVITPDGVIVSISNTQVKHLDSTKIQGGIRGSVELIHDALNQFSMFKTAISPMVSNGNFNSVPIVFSGAGMIVEEINDLSRFIAKFPVRADSVKLTSTEVEFVFDVSIAATAIGE